MLRDFSVWGEDIRLDPLRPRHASALWFAVEEALLTAWQEVRFDTERALRRWVGARVRAAHRPDAFAFVIGDGDDGVPRGSISLYDIEWDRRCGGVGHAWVASLGGGEAVLAEAVGLLVEEAFRPRPHVGLTETEFEMPRTWTGPINKWLTSSMDFLESSGEALASDINDKHRLTIRSRKP